MRPANRLAGGIANNISGAELIMTYFPPYEGSTKPSTEHFQSIVAFFQLMFLTQNIMFNE